MLYKCYITGQFNCSLDPASASPYFRLHPMSRFEYQIRTDHLLDRESRAAHHLTLTCEDEGVPPLDSRAELRVEVADANDNAPQFDRPTYSAEIRENNALGAVVARPRASDADAGDNARISYRLEEEEAEGEELRRYVEVDAETGVVVVKVSLDYEETKHLRFHVVAIDAAPPQRTGNYR